MKIYKKKDNLVVEIPLKQRRINVYGDDDLGKTDNLIGIIAGDEYTISQLIDLAYKGTQQEGMPIIYFENREELKEACKIGDIDIWEHPICGFCNKVIRGCHTFKDGKNMCSDCEYKLNNQLIKKL